MLTPRARRLASTPQSQQPHKAGWLAQTGRVAPARPGHTGRVYCTGGGGGGLPLSLSLHLGPGSYRKTGKGGGQGPSHPGDSSDRHTKDKTAPKKGPWSVPQKGFFSMQCFSPPSCADRGATVPMMRSRRKDDDAQPILKGKGSKTSRRLHSDATNCPYYNTEGKDGERKHHSAASPQTPLSCRTECLRSRTPSRDSSIALISGGGSSPSLSARCHRSRRVMPRQGP